MLHPVLWATGITWEQGRITGSIDLAYGYERRDSWLVSPFRHMLESDTRRLHRRIGRGEAALDFPVLREFREAGLTDWLALLFHYGWAVERMMVNQLGVIFSWATDKPGGWTAAELAEIEALSQPLALAVKGSSGRDTTRALLSTYIGRNAADQVIAGRVQRGSVEREAAVILYADLRGFTDFADVTSPEEVTRRLNACFDAMGEPVRRAGGEILKFLGDGLLAVFLPDAKRSLDQAAAAALEAAREILAGLARLNAAETAGGKPPLPVDLVLHEGVVTHGNVGTADRLDFTIIGPAVNEATRIEGLCKALGHHLLISDSFARAAPALKDHLRSLGRHTLRGVREQREVFTVD
jgi:adenylate cyclase